MKKCFLFIAALAASVSLASAQADKYLEFFPNTAGTKLVSKSYDASSNQIGTMTVTVDKAFDYADGTMLELNMMMQDSLGNVVHNGKIDARYEDGNFFVNPYTLTLSPCISKYVTPVVAFSGDALFYPNTYTVEVYPADSDKKMPGGKFTVRDRDDNKELASVKVYNREYDKKEKVVTPAGTFMAGKVEFDLDVNNGDDVETYHVKEWHAPGAGIVRSEVYNHHGLLEDYSILTSMTRTR